MTKPVDYRLPIDQALEETKYGRFNYFVIVVSGLILINVVVECIGINFVLPVTDCDMDLNYQKKGILAAAGFLGIISSSHLWGYLADTTGRRKVIRPTLIIGYLFTVASSFSPNFETLLILRYLNGFVLSAGSAAVFPYLGEFHTDRMRNRAIMSAGFICAAASLLYPIVAWAVINQSWSFDVPLLDIEYKPWRMYILVIGLLGLVCGLSLFYIPESPKYLISIGREEEVIEILRKMYSTNTGNPRESFKVTSILPEVKEIRKLKVEEEEKGCAVKVLLRSMWNQTAPLFMKEHRRNTTVICFIIFWIFFTAHGLLMWFPFVLNKVMQFTSVNPNAKLQICEILYIMDSTESVVVNSTAEVLESKCNQSLELSTYQHTLSLEAIYLALYLGVGYFTGKLGRIRTLFIILMICGVGGIFSATVTIPIVAVYSLQVFLVCGLGVTVLNSITVDIFPTHLRAMACCVSLMIGRIGSVFGTNFIGLLLEHNCQIGLLTASIALILNGFLALLLPKNIGVQKQNKPSIEGFKQVINYIIHCLKKKMGDTKNINRVSIDEALEETKFGKFNYFVTLISGFVIVNVSLELVGIGFVLPIIDCDMDLSFGEKGILGAVGFLGIISSSHIWGFLADTIGRRKVVRPTLIACYISSVISSFSPNYTTLIFLRYVNGFLLSAGSATIYAYLGEFHCDKTRNRAIMAAGFISAACALGFPFVAWAVINQTWSFEIAFLHIIYKPWRLYFVVIGLLGLVCGISMFYLPESPKYLLSIGKESEAIKVLKRIYSINTGNPRDSFKINGILPDTTENCNKIVDNASKGSVLKKLIRSMWNQTAPLFMREYRRNTALTCTIQFWIFFTYHGLYVWFPHMLNSVMQFTQNNPDTNLEMCEILGIMQSTKETERVCNQVLELSTYHHTFSLEVIFVTLFLGIGYFTGKVGRRPSLFLILLLCGFCGVLCATVTIPIVAVYSLQVWLVCGLGATVLSSITVDIFPTHLRAMAICISLMCGRIGSVSGTNVVGALLENHCKTGLLIAGIFLMLSGVLAFLLPRSSKKTKTINDNGA
ncbi:uncharacterized protein LOC129909530 [Episyrphus balteatus]|uniref:uncharacterized protein LOC129909530 n=1 Tax=Episyrphus balteatus TaxID=286459 RepID=UPI0024862D0C|nr:uncharacterized protein LOC129909530 [Episyrphus balteatus]